MYTSYREKPPSSLLKYIKRSEGIKTFHTEENDRTRTDIYFKTLLEKKHPKAKWT